MTRQEFEVFEKKYPAGTKIRLISMENETHPVEAGTTGTIVSSVYVQGDAVVSVNWDNGRTLNLIPSIDQFEKYDHNSKHTWSDNELTALWGELSDVPFDEKDKLDCDEWFGFKKGDDKYEDIWKWFDKHLSMGLGKFMNSKNAED